MDGALKPKTSLRVCHTLSTQPYEKEYCMLGNVSSIAILVPALRSEQNLVIFNDDETI
jgi:hypothetical protein